MFPSPPTSGALHTHRCPSLGWVSSGPWAKASPGARMLSNAPEASNLEAANQATVKTPVRCIMNLNWIQVSGDLRVQEGREVSPVDRARISVIRHAWQGLPQASRKPEKPVFSSLATSCIHPVNILLRTYYVSGTVQNIGIPMGPITWSLP